MEPKDITTEEFDEALLDVLDQIYGPGAAKLAVAHGGVWDVVSEEYNNAAIEHIEEQRDVV